jgi:membrane protein implicated in regulation of membrane protease activity
MLANMGVQKQGWWQLFVSTHGLVAVINSILAAVFVGLLVSALFNASIPIAIISGLIVFVISEYLHFRYQNVAYNQSEKNLKVLFPSETMDTDS